MKGKKGEDSVTASLRYAGASVVQSPGSRGSADQVAIWPQGKKWFVQTKSSNSGKPAELAPRERQNLIKRADQNNATPVTAQRIPNKIIYKSARNGRQLKP